jgi:hypothetical protein
VPTTKTQDGASGEFHSQVLVLTVDTKPLKSIINNVLSPIFAKLPTYARTQLQPVLDFGPKIVLTVGESDASAAASPAFDFGGGGTTGTSGSGNVTGGGGSATGGGGGATLPNTGTGLPGTGNGAPGAAQTPVTLQQTALGLPPLGTVPRALILGALLIAAVIGWFFRRAAAAVLGGAGRCGFGLVTGVPDLRKG